MNPIRFDLCKYLRWKSHSRDSGSPAAILESLQRQILSQENLCVPLIIYLLRDNSL